jgi:hypothetical protein
MDGNGAGRGQIMGAPPHTHTGVGRGNLPRTY